MSDIGFILLDRMDFSIVPKQSIVNSDTTALASARTAGWKDIEVCCGLRKIIGLPHKLEQEAVAGKHAQAMPEGSQGIIGACGMRWLKAN